MDKMVYDESFLGATDFSALSILCTLVKLKQPDRVLQLGTYIGFSAIVLAGVLATNSKPGKLWTVEPNAKAHDKARRYAQSAGITNLMEFLDGSSDDPEIHEKLRRSGPFDLVYIDSSHEYHQTLKELKNYVEDEAITTTSTVVTLHDAGTQAACFDPTDCGGVRQALEEWFNCDDNRSRYMLFIFEPPMYPNPCGLGVIRKIY